MEAILNAYYNLNSPSLYAGVKAVYSEAKKRDPKVTIKLVKKILTSQETYSIHKPVQRRFSRNSTSSPGLFAKAQIDLIDWRTLKHYNSGYSYILVCIDVFPLHLRSASQTENTRSSMHRFQQNVPR
jgi:hypothetical protein